MSTPWAQLLSAYKDTMLIIPSKVFSCSVWNFSPVPSIFYCCCFWWSVGVSIAVLMCVSPLGVPAHQECSQSPDSPPGGSEEGRSWAVRAQSMESHCWEEEWSPWADQSLSQWSLSHAVHAVAALKTRSFCKQICSRSICSWLIQVTPARPIWKLLCCAEDVNSPPITRNALCWAEFSSILVTSTLVIWCRSAD